VFPVKKQKDDCQNSRQKGQHREPLQKKMEVGWVHIGLEVGIAVTWKRAPGHNFRGERFWGRGRGSEKGVMGNYRIKGFLPSRGEKRGHGRT